IRHSPACAPSCGYRRRRLVEEAEEILRSLRRERLARDAAQLGEETRGVDDIGGLRSRAAQRHRRKGGRNGLDQGGGWGRRFRDLAERLRLLEGNDPGEGQEKS